MGNHGDKTAIFPGKVQILQKTSPHFQDACLSSVLAPLVRFVVPSVASHSRLDSDPSLAHSFAVAAGVSFRPGGFFVCFGFPESQPQRGYSAIKKTHSLSILFRFTGFPLDMKRPPFFSMGPSGGLRTAED